MTATPMRGRQDLLYILISATYTKINGILDFDENELVNGFQDATNMQTPFGTRDFVRMRPDGFYEITFNIQYDHADAAHIALRSKINSETAEEFWFVVRKADGTVSEKCKISGFVKSFARKGKDNEILTFPLVIIAKANPDYTTALPAGIPATLGAAA